MYIEKIKSFFKKLNIKCFVFGYILMMMVMPIVQRATSDYLSTYFYMIIVVCTVLFSFIACSIGNVREYMLFLGPFVAYEMIVMLSKNNPDVTLAGYQVLLFLLPACIGFYLVTNRCFVELHTVLLVTIIMLTCVTTTIGCINNPNAARVLATTATSQDPTAIIYDWQNIGGYGFVYSTVLLYPFMILAFKMKKLHIAFVVVFTALIYYMVIQASYTYALMLLMMSMLLFFIKRDITLKRFILLMVGFVLVVLLFRVAIAALFSWFGELIGNQSMVDKVNAAFLGKDAVDNFDDDRGALYQLSVDLFLKHPLLGSLAGGSKVTGGHSFILDSFALYGLLGGALLVLMYVGIYRTFFLPLKGKPGYVIIFWAFMQPIMLSVINTGMWLDNLCLYTPLLACAIYGGDVYLNIVKPKPVPQIPVNVLRKKDY